MVSAKWAIVTGANRGLGLEVARKLVQEGHPVIITARDEAAGQKVASELRGSSGAKVEALKLDVSSAASIDAFVSEVAAKYSGQIGLLVNNAAIAVHKWDAPSHASSITTNVEGPVRLTTGLLPHLAEGARVLNVASGAGQLGMLTPDYSDPIKSASTVDDVIARAQRFDPDSPLPKENTLAPSYSVSKAALIRATQLLNDHPDSKAKGVAVNSVCPGWCATDMAKHAEEVMGRKAPRTAAQGADSILLAAKLPGGSFSRDGNELDWTAKPTFE